MKATAAVAFATAIEIPERPQLHLLKQPIMASERELEGKLLISPPNNWTNFTIIPAAPVAVECLSMVRVDAEPSVKIRMPIEIDTSLDQ